VYTIVYDGDALTEHPTYDPSNQNAVIEVLNNNVAAVSLTFLYDFYR